MGTELERLAEVSAADMMLWAFCLYCSHAQLVDPRFLFAKVKDGDDSLVTLAQLFKCGNCKRKGVKLIPTPRTMVSFDRMGLGADASKSALYPR